MGFLNSYPYTDFHELNLDWIVSHFKEFVDEIAGLEEWRSTHETQYEELKAFMDQLEEGVLPDAMYDSFRVWFNENAFDLVGNMIKFITVYLNKAGYICIRIPSQWDALIFNTTGLDISTPLQPEYGHLTISY